jgi:hypothetical protein
MSRDQIIETYLSRIAALLPGPSGIRADMISEIRSGLLDATECHQSAGQDALDAATTAVAEFGEPREVAAAVGRELAAGQARRLTLQLAVTAIPIGVLWGYAAQASDAGTHPVWPWGWLEAPPVPLAVAAAAIAAISALVARTTTGRAARLLGDRTRLATTAAAFGGFAAAATDLAIITLLAIAVATSMHKLSLEPVAVAAMASAARLTLARRAARRCLAARTVLA